MLKAQEKCGRPQKGRLDKRSKVWYNIYVSKLSPISPSLTVSYRLNLTSS